VILVSLYNTKQKINIPGKEMFISVDFLVPEKMVEKIRESDKLLLLFTVILGNFSSQIYPVK